VLVAALSSWLYHHFVTKGLGLDLNAMNTMLLTLALVLQRSSADFSRAIRGAVVVCWPVLVLYHLYGGVAGLLQFTSVGERMAGAFAAWSTPLTFTFLTAAASSIVAIFIPSSGGQWVIQGFVTSKAAADVGTTAQHGLLAMSVGDQVGNLMSPFWPVLIAGIARVDFAPSLATVSCSAWCGSHSASPSSRSSRELGGRSRLSYVKGTRQ
jgi:short-chain fatty acids transporter